MDAEKALREAFERLKSNTPKILPKGSKISNTNIAKEAGIQSRSALRKDRYPILCLEIDEYKIKEKQEKEAKNNSAKRKVRTLKQRLRDAELQAERLQNICDAQQELIEHLRDEISDFQKNVSKPPHIQ